MVNGRLSVVQPHSSDNPDVVYMELPAFCPHHSVVDPKVALQ